MTFSLLNNYSRAIDDADLWPVMHIIDGIFKLKVIYKKDKEIFELFVNEILFQRLPVLEDGYGKSIIFLKIF